MLGSSGDTRGGLIALYAPEVIGREGVEPRFHALLAEERVDRQRPSSAHVERVWAAMWRFGQEPVSGAVPPKAMGCLPAMGSRGFPTGPEYFELTMRRQLVFYDGDEYDVMMQLYCSFCYVPTPELRALGDGETRFDVPDDPRWTDAMDRRGYRGVRALGAEPVALEIEFSES